MRPRLGLRHHATSLSIAGAVEYGLQMLLPVLLVRVLTRDQFGDYRLVWLVAATGQAVFSFFMPQSLYYLLPRANGREQRLVIGNTTVFLMIAGVTAGAVLIAFKPYLPPSLQGLWDYSLAGPLFVALWIAASAFDTLPTADGHAEWQARGMIFLAATRVVMIAVAGAMTRDVGMILWAMCLFAGIKTALTHLYALWVKGFRGLGTDSALARRQIAYAYPFALATGQFLLKTQADQWVVASLHSPALFSLISIGAVVLPISTFIRNPINNALLPRVNELLRDGNSQPASDLLAKGYKGVAILLVPVLGLIFVARAVSDC
jgi:O-antigen/teichoic acid export membrane protein